jgi:hypothetical protein
MQKLEANLTAVSYFMKGRDVVERLSETWHREDESADKRERIFAFISP